MKFSHPSHLAYPKLFTNNNANNVKTPDVNNFIISLYSENMNLPLANNAVVAKSSATANTKKFLII
jgi:hypothetical protein